MMNEEHCDGAGDVEMKVGDIIIDEQGHSQ
jgi:hypothetical protein